MFSKEFSLKLVGHQKADSQRAEPFVSDPHN